MLSNAHFLAKIRFDTAENEPAKNLQNLQNFAILQICRERARRFLAPLEEAVLEPRGKGA